MVGSAGTINDVRHQLDTALQSGLLKVAKSKCRIDNLRAVRKLADTSWENPRLFGH